MKKLSILWSCVLALCVNTLPVHAQLSDFDANKPIGWATLGNGVTGDETNTVYHVTNLDEMKAAFKKIDGAIKNRTIYFDADIYVPEKFFVGEAENLTLYGKPGTRLYNRIHTADQDSSGIFYFKDCKNLIIRNITMECAGAFDNSSADNMQLVTCQNVWLDHCDFLDGVDGCLDMKTGTDNVTITWCRFRYLKAPWPKPANKPKNSDDHRFPLLIGSGDKNTEDIDKLNTTIAYCWFDEGCMERTPRVRKGKIHVVNCDYTNVGAHYLVGPGYLANIYEEKCDMSAIDLNLPNNSEFTKNTQDGSKTLQWKNYATEKNYKDYNLVITDVLGGQEVKSSYGGKPFYNPYSDGSAAGVIPYDKTLVKAFVENAETGAGATLDYDLLPTRGNPNQKTAEEAGVATGINGNHMAVQPVKTTFYTANGTQIAKPQRGITIVKTVMSDGTTRTQKLLNR
jgi:pectate lyase